jgi:acetylglutamate kinase
VPDGATEAVLVDYGLVGDIQAVNPAVLQHLLEGGFMPVVAPLSGGEGDAVYNVNADTIASGLAVALGAEKLFVLLSVPGLLRDARMHSSLVPLVSLAGLAELETAGVVSGGMRPKLAAARSALRGGVASVHLVSGVAPDALLAEVFTNEGSGTMIVAGEAARDGMAGDAAAEGLAAEKSWPGPEASTASLGSSAAFA